MFEISSVVDIPDGNYTATLESVIPDKGNYGDYRKWTFLAEVTTDGKLEILPVSAMSSANTGPQSKSYKWLAALLGYSPKAGEKIDSPNGKRCVITVTHNDKGFPTVSEVGPFVEPQQTLPGIPR